MQLVHQEASGGRKAEVYSGWDEGGMLQKPQDFHHPIMSGSVLFARACYV